jgi:hypothetical protein
MKTHDCQLNVPFPAGLNLQPLNNDLLQTLSVSLKMCSLQGGLSAYSNLTTDGKKMLVLLGAVNTLILEQSQAGMMTRVSARTPAVPFQNIYRDKQQLHKTLKNIFHATSPQIFQKLWSHFQIPGARWLA